MARINGQIVTGRRFDGVFDHVADQFNEPQPQILRAEVISGPR
jgi:hypothetical protein